MYAESESELRDLVVQKLDTCGFLNKIKAELRACVLLAFEEEEGNILNKNPLSNKKLDDFLKTADGQIAVSLVREFLEYFNMKYTLSVFDPEISNSSEYLNTLDLCKRMKLNPTDCNGPVISLLSKSSSISDRIASGSHINHSNNSSKDVSENSFNAPLKNIQPEKQRKLSSDSGSSNTSTFQGNVSNQKAPKEKLSSLNDTFDKSSVSETNKKVQEEPKLNPIETYTGRRISKNTVFSNTPVLNNLLQSAANSDLMHDDFFDEPVVPEKPSYFKLSSDKDELTDRSPSIFNSDKSSQSSLKNLPALTKKSDDWTFTKESLKTLPELKRPNSGMINHNKLDKDDPGSNESSEHQLNSEESIEEEIEEFSVDDLSSLSLGDDVTSDQTVSQVSVVDGIDHIEACHTVI